MKNRFIIFALTSQKAAPRILSKSFTPSTAKHRASLHSLSRIDQGVQLGQDRVGGSCIVLATSYKLEIATALLQQSPSELFFATLKLCHRMPQVC